MKGGPAKAANFSRSSGKYRALKAPRRIEIEIFAGQLPVQQVNDA